MDPVTISALAGAANQAGIFDVNVSGNANESIGGHARRLAAEYASGHQIIADANFQILKADPDASSAHHRSGAIRAVDQAMQKYLDGTYTSLDQVRASIRSAIGGHVGKYTGWTADLVNLYVNTAAYYCGQYTPPITLNQVRNTEYADQQTGAILRTTMQGGGTSGISGDFTQSGIPWMAVAAAAVIAVFIFARR